MSNATVANAVCAYCGLPLPRPWWRSSETSAAQRYCCFGCSFAASIVREPADRGDQQLTLVRLGLAIFFSMNVMVFTMALWSYDFYGPASSANPLSRSLHDLFRYLCLLFAVPVLWLLGGPLLANAWRNLRDGQVSTDLLLILGVAASFGYSLIAVFREDGPIYFEVGCAVLVLVTLGRWLEATGKHRATEALAALQRLLPDTVRVTGRDQENAVPLAAAQAGDCLRVLPGERVPCDGIVLRHPATVDEQLLTGESLPVVKEVGSLVGSGVLNLETELFLQVTTRAEEGTLARFAALVRQSLARKSRYERIADQATRWFLPAMVAIALGAALAHAMAHGPVEGILAGLAVLLIACPCALGIATPLAVWAALGEAARHSIAFRRGDALEQLANIRGIRFDKTGTLTVGVPALASLVADNPAEADAVWDQALTLAAASSHGHAQAIVRHAQAAGRTRPPNQSAVITLPGRGLLAEAADGPILLGSPRLMAERGLVLRDDLATALHEAIESGQAITCIGWGGRMRGFFAFDEQLRPETAEALAALHGMGLDLAIWTGDQPARAAVIARELGCPARGGLLPEEKVALVEADQRQLGAIAFVGDGLNDAGALARSDVGLAMGCGADVSREAAAVCLLGNDLRQLPWLIDLARRTRRTIRVNLVWAFLYNVGGIALTCAGWLSPVWAALAMVVSSGLVLSNSLRLAADRQAAASQSQVPAIREPATLPARGAVTA